MCKYTAMCSRNRRTCSNENKRAVVIGNEKEDPHQHHNEQRSSSRVVSAVWASRAAEAHHRDRRAGRSCPWGGLVRAAGRSRRGFLGPWVIHSLIWAVGPCVSTHANIHWHDAIPEKGVQKRSRKNIWGHNGWKPNKSDSLPPQKKSPCPRSLMNSK